MSNPRFKLTRCSVFLAVIVGIGGSQSAHAEFLNDQLHNQLDDAPASLSSPIGDESDDGNFSFNAVPLPVVDPTLGEGLAPVGLATFSIDPHDSRSPRSTIGLVYARTNKESEVYGGGGALYFAEDRFRADFLVGKLDLKLDFFGLGSDVLASNPIPFSVESKLLRVGAAVRFAPDTYIGLRAIAADAELGVYSDRPILGRFRLNVELRGFGPFLQYDTRDSTWFPTSGTRADLKLIRFDEVLLSGDSFNFFEGSAAHHLSVTDDVVAAGKIRAAHAGSNAPFFMFPFVQIRGFPALRFLGQNVVQAETELRWFPFRERNGFLSDIGFVTFAGAGVAASEFQDWDKEPIAYAGGFGLRYRISEKDGMNAGLDLAWGRDNESAIYFRIGEAF